MPSTRSTLLGLIALISACESSSKLPAPDDSQLAPRDDEGKPAEVGGPKAPGAPSAPAVDDVPYPISRGRSAQWKRAAAIEADLMQGLELGRDEVCSELGRESCIRAVHTVALGSNDPFKTGLLRPSTGPTSTTPLAIDRVTLSACSRRARADREGPAKVFTALDLSGPAPAVDSEAVGTTITMLFRRLLARDPKPDELSTVRELLEGAEAPQSAEDFATLACFVVASSLEALFF